MKCGLGKCFRCIREGTDHGWAYECDTELLSRQFRSKFDKKAQKAITTKELRGQESLEYLQGVVDEALLTAKTRLKKLGMKLPQDEVEVIGDSIARLYLFLATRKQLITIDDLRPIAPIIRRATRRSLPCHAVAYVIDGKGLKRPFPRCWLNLNAGRSKENDEQRANDIRGINRRYQVSSKGKS